MEYFMQVILPRIQSQINLFT